jgi:PAS domain S-box-containing protein
MSKHAKRPHTKPIATGDEIFSSIIQLVHDAIIVIDEEQKIIFFNQGAEKIFGYNASEVIGQRLDMLLPPHVSDFHLAYVRSFAKDPETSRLMGERKEVSGRHKNGTIFPAEASIVKVSSGKEIFFTAILQDITERKQIEDALRESEGIHRLVLDNVDEIVYLVEMGADNMFTNQVRFVSGRVEQILGYQPEEFIHDRDLWFRIIHPDDAPALAESTRAIFASRQPGLREYRMRHKRTGDYHWLEDHVVPQLDAAGVVIGQFGVARDVTEQRKAEAALREREEYLANLMDTVDDAIFTIRMPERRIEYVNRALTDMFGYLPEEVIGQTTQIFYLDDADFTNYGQRLQDALARGQRQMRAELELRRKDGERLWAEVHTTFLAQDGQPLRVISMVRDITERKQAAAILHASEKRFRALIENASDVVALVSVNGTILYESPALTRVLGYAVEERTDRAFFELVHPDDLPDVTNRFAQLLQQPVGTVSAQFRYRHKDGTWRWMEGTGQNLLAEPGVQAIVANYRDITERKQAEEVLRQSEEKYRMLVEQASEGIFVADADGNHIEVNSRGSEMLGYTRAEILRLKISDLLEPGELERAPLRLDELRQGKTLLTERTFVRKNGSIFPAEVSVKMIASGGLQAFVRNITERKRAERTLRESEKQYRDLFESTSDLIQAVATDGRVLFANRAWREALGYTEQELINLNIDRVVHPDALPQCFETLQRAMSGEQIDRIETRLVTKEGKIIIVEGSVTCRFEASQPMAVTCFLRDITTYKLAEAETQLLLALTKAIAEAENFDSALALALRLVCRNSGWDFGEVWIPSHDGTHLELGSVYYGMESFQSVSKGFEFAPGIGLPGQVWASGKSVWLPDVTLEANFPRAALAEEAGFKAAVGIPVLTGDIVVAVINFFLREARQEDERMVALVSAVAAQLGTIFQRKQSEEALSQRLGELEVLYQSGLAFSQLLKPKEIAQNIIDLLDQKLDWHHTTIRLYHPQDETLELLAFNQPGLRSEQEKRALEERFKTSIAKKGQGLSGWVVEHGRSVRTSNLINDERYVETFPGLQSGLYVPIIIGERTIGVISIESEVADAFSEADEHLVVTLAAQVASALENARLFQETVRRLEHLQSLHTIDIAISGSMDISLVLNVIIEQVISQLGVDAAVVLLSDPVTQALKYTAGRGFRTDALQHTRLPLGEGYAGQVALGRQMVQIPDLQTRKTDFLRSPTFSQEGFVSYVGVPLIAKGEIKGVLEIFYRTAFEAETEWLNFLETLAGQAAIAIDNATLFKGLQLSNIQLTMAYDATIDGWSHALDLRDKETEGHTQRVTELTERLARTMGIREAEIIHIRRGALLHDIGKMGVPDGILFKPDKLTDEEWAIMKRHPGFAFDMLSPIAYLKPALDIPYCHHEKWDGTGYPRGLKGEQIPLAARLFAMVDVYDALTSDRPYRKGWSKEKTLEYIREQSGTHFDPQLVEVFMTVIGDLEEK